MRIETIHDEVRIIIESCKPEEAQQQVLPAFQAQPATEALVILDLTRLDHLDAKGVQLVATLHRFFSALGAYFRVDVPQHPIMRTLEECRLDRFLDVRAQRKPRHKFA
jgi:anti-anti-sigma factor